MMITAPDFNKKQIVFVLFNEGEKLAFSNDNLVVKNADGKIKFQCTCYRVFLVYIVGHCSLTSVIIQKAKKFGFFLALMTPGFRMYALIGAEKDGNTLLKKKQYQYEELDIAKHIIENKIQNQAAVLSLNRKPSEAVKETIEMLNTYSCKIPFVNTINELMAYEGLSSKLYFKNHFNNICWHGRQPRVKKDVVNSVLDIGYTLLFAFVDSLLSSYGFDTFCGVLHTQFYMRKSLVCDIVEPFRPLVDAQIKKSINLKQIKDDDFILINGQYKLKWEKSADYIQFLMKPIMDNKDDMFSYIQDYYRAFMKGLSADDFPLFEIKK